MPLILDVFLDGVTTPAGTLTRDDDNNIRFQYGDQTPLPHPISLSMPIRDAPFEDPITRAFFSNLLFENTQRDRIMQVHGLAENDVVGQLFHLGADCPGALSCVPQGSGPTKHPGDLTTDYVPLSDSDLILIMKSLRDHRRVPDATGDPSPLAGVQGKIALAQLPDGRFALPRKDRNVPTTHILKVPRRAEMELVNLEHRAMGLLANLQPHPVAITEPFGEGDLQGLLITRFDRRVKGTQVFRIHQEDFCQAMGLGPSLKYQRNGIADRHFAPPALRNILDQTAEPGISRQAFLDLTLCNLLLGNTDNHGKNHALIYTGPRPRLAPAYDVVPTLLDQTVSHQLSFDIGRAQYSEDITINDLDALISDLGFRRRTPALTQHIKHMIDKAIGLIDTQQGPKAKRLGDVMAHQAQHLANLMDLKTKIPERDLVITGR